jgi:hypothetical protein
MLSIMPKPSRSLAKDGQFLWNSIVTEFHLDNAAAAEILLLACESLDRLKSFEAERAKAGPPPAGKSNPLNRDITQTTALLASLLGKLDAFVRRRDQQPRSVGRPPRNLHWDGPDALA